MACLPTLEGAGRGDQPAVWWETDYLQPLSSWREQQFVVTGIYLVGQKVHSGLHNPPNELFGQPIYVF